MNRRIKIVSVCVVLITCVLSVSVRAADYTPPTLPTEGKFLADKIVKITDTGAIADGKTLCTNAINTAIDQCASAGGGIVEIPARDGAADKTDTIYLTGAIHLKSNITLQIDDGVTLKFSTDRSQYPLVKTRYECTDVMNYSPLIYAYQCENIKITGKGTLDGQGQAWWDWIRGKTATRVITQFTNDRDGKFPIEDRVFGDKIQGLRPCFIEPYECKNVVIEGVTIRQSPFWNIHPLYSQDVIVRGVTVFGTGPNTDGCDPDSCKNVLVENCTFNTGDDCIAIKSGRDGDGICRNAPCENITIRNCTMNGGHGAVTMGSETSGGIHHILAENCHIDGPDTAIRLKSTRGRGGGIEDVMIRNITISKANKTAITIDMKYTQTQPAPQSETTPVFRNIAIENLTCDDTPQAINVIGLPESHVQGLTFKNVTIKANKGAHLEYVDQLMRDNVTLNVTSGQAWDMSEVVEAK
jgi:polygalacturonase